MNIKKVRYLKDAQTSPDNNIAENVIRPFVIGRKNWLFCDTPSSAFACATFYSLLDTAYGFEHHTMRGINKVSVKLNLAFVVMLSIGLGWSRDTHLL